MWGKKNKAEVSITSGEQAIANKETEGLSQSQIVLRRFVRHKAAMTSVFVLTFLVLAVFSALETKIGPVRIPGWWKFKYDQLLDLRVEGCPEGIVGCPSLDVVPSFIDGTGMGLGRHPFGQDDIGHDYFSMVMRGAQRSLYVTVVIGLLGGTIGIIIGSISGYFRGWIDAALMRFTDFIITIPTIIIGSVVGFHFGNLGVGFLAFYL
jgi:peptide/nickel transport system permease protein